MSVTDELPPMLNGREIDYGSCMKTGLASGLAMFVLGALGSTVARTALGGLPDWEMTLFTDLLALGVVVGFLSVLGFGIVLPLTE